MTLQQDIRDAFIIAAFHNTECEGPTKCRYCRSVRGWWDTDRPTPYDAGPY